MQTNHAIELPATRLFALKEKASALAARRAMLLDAADKSNRLREQADAALALKPDVEAFLDALQARLHRKAVGRFEELLTCIMGDVFGQGDRVSVELASRRQQAEASFSVGNGENAEDALHGRGGSVANVLSTGLRFIALGRSRLRRFIVLDEPDCWLAPDKVPAFMGVVATLSRETGIQVLLITHHDPGFFEECATLVKLKPNRKNGLSVSCIGGVPPRWGDAGAEGIRSIRLENFMAYKSSTIPLSPGVTVLQGANDIGKSAVVTALRSMLRGEARDTFIRHGEASCRVELDMGPAGLVSWERYRKGSPKSRYTHLKGTEKLHESPDASPPDWLAAMGFDCDGELDFQIGHQKKPVFLLGETGAKQASVLSVGRDAAWLDAMRKRHRDDCRRDTSVAKAEGERVETLRRQWQTLEPAEKANAGLSEMPAMLAALQSDAMAIERGMALLERLEQLRRLPHENLADAPRFDGALADTQGMARLADGIAWAGRFLSVKAMGEAPAAPPVTDNAALDSLCCKLEGTGGLPVALMGNIPIVPCIADNAALASLCAKMSRTDGLPAAALPQPPAMPDLLPVRELLQAGVKLWRAIKAGSTDSLPLPPAAPAIGGTSGLHADCEKIGTLAMQAEAFLTEKAESERDMAAAEADYARAVQLSGGVCPTCGNALMAAGGHARH